MENYNRVARPVRKSNDAIQVKLKYTLAQILTILEKEEIMISQGWLVLEWQDYRLQWNPADYGNVSSMYFPAYLLWVPDINLYNKGTRAAGNREPGLVGRLGRGSSGRRCQPFLCHLEKQPKGLFPNFHIYKDERLKHADMFRNYTGDYGYLK
uniref:Neurotransmitter-gated ion-channel ligand-binding domain-containing protein n=1 Tax=Romanomermis culicivorax TaxID=13658 RepID=A0A915JNC8_ROMCU